MKPQAQPASSDSDSESESDDSVIVDRKPSAMRKTNTESDSDEDSSSDDSDSDQDEGSIRKSKNVDEDGGDKWSDEDDSEANDSEDEEDETVPSSMSLMERLRKQEDKQASLTTTLALKMKRERRSRAIPIAKERLQQFKKKQRSEKDDEVVSDNDIDGASKANKKRKSKHAPTEVSSRRRHNKSLNESGIGVQIGSNRYQPRDPRMSSMSGHLDAQQFDQNFGFLHDMQENEIKLLKRKLKALQKPGPKGQRERKRLGIRITDTPESLQERLQDMQTKLARQNQDRLERNAKRAVKQKIHAQVAEGKGGMYFPKRHELKEMKMEAKVEEIKKAKGKNGLDKYLAKRRKKQKSVHAKKMRTAGGFGGDRRPFGDDD